MCGREGFYPSTCPVKGESLSQTFNKPLGVMFPQVTVFSGVFSCTVDWSAHTYLSQDSTTLDIETGNKDCLTKGNSITHVLWKKQWLNAEELCFSHFLEDAAVFLVREVKRLNTNTHFSLQIRIICFDPQPRSSFSGWGMHIFVVVLSNFQVVMKFKKLRVWERWLSA